LIIFSVHYTRRIQHVKDKIWRGTILLLVKSDVKEAVEFEIHERGVTSMVQQCRPIFRTSREDVKLDVESVPIEVISSGACLDKKTILPFYTGTRVYAHKNTRKEYK